MLSISKDCTSHDTYMVGKAEGLPTPGLKRRNYVVYGCPSKLGDEQFYKCNIGEQMKRPLEELHHCDCTRYQDEWDKVKTIEHSSIFVLNFIF